MPAFVPCICSLRVQNLKILYPCQDRRGRARETKIGGKAEPLSMHPQSSRLPSLPEMNPTCAQNMHKTAGLDHMVVIVLLRAHFRALSGGHYMRPLGSEGPDHVSLMVTRQHMHIIQNIST